MQIRKLKLDDDLKQVSKLIYLTDKYIYPRWFQNVKRAQLLLPEIIKRDTMYNYSLIHVAIIDDKIVGVLVCMSKYPKNNYSEILDAYKVVNEKVDEALIEVNKGYLEKMDFDFEKNYISCVCVDPSFRGKGIAKALLHSLDDDTYQLAAVKDNFKAIKLYESVGFTYLYDYLGFSDVPCVEMIWRKKS